MPLLRPYEHHSSVRLHQDTQDVENSGQDQCAGRQKLPTEVCQRERGRFFKLLWTSTKLEKRQPDRPALARRRTDSITPYWNGQLRACTSLFLTAGQIACIALEHAYEVCHHGTLPRTASDEACASFTARLPQALHSLERTSTDMFVVSALTHGALAAGLYHLQRRDRYQGVCLRVGLAVGIIACYPSLANAKGRQVDVSTLALAISVALAVSALGHFLVSLIFGSECVVRISATQMPAHTEGWVDEKNGSYESV